MLLAPSGSLGVASSSRPSTADSQRTVARGAPRMTRYRYVVNDLPPALPPPTGDLPPTPPQSQSAFTRFTSQPVPYTPTSATTTTFSPTSPESQPVTPPPRPPRSSSRPAPPSRSATPTPAMLDLPEPKQMRRRSRSLGSLPAAPPPYESIVNPRFNRGDPSPAAVGGRGRSGTDASAPLSRADLLSAAAEGRAPSPLTLAARSDSPMTLAGDADTLHRRGLRTLRRMSKSLTQLRSRSKSVERGAASSLFRPLVTVIPPMPDKAPPFPDDRPSIDSTTTLSGASGSSRAAAAQDDSSLGRAPPVMLSNTLETDQVSINPPRPAPKPPSAFKGDPSLGKAPLAARDDSAVREQIVTHGLKRVSRSFTNLRVMTSPDALQAEAQAHQALRLHEDAGAVIMRSRTPNPPPPRAPPPEPAAIVTKSSNRDREKHRRGMLPTPPHTPPSPAPIGEQPIPASRKARSPISARMKAISPMSMMTTFAPRARPPSSDSNSTRSTYSTSTTSSSWSPKTSRSSSDRERERPAKASPSPTFTPSPMSRLAIPRERERLPPTAVISPVDPVAASNNRISFLKPAMVRPFMGQRI